jgi:predicted protein tyrosine phosphatase
MIRALFLCGKARARGPTAAQVAAQWEGVKADCAGLSNDADDMLSVEQLDWADVIFVMEPRQKTRLASKYPGAARGKQIISLDVPDLYSFMQPELVEILTKKLRPFLDPGRGRGGRK